MKTCMPVLHLNEEGTSQTMKGCFLVIEGGRLSHQQQLGSQGTQQPADEEEEPVTARPMPGGCAQQQLLPEPGKQASSQSPSGSVQYSKTGLALALSAILSDIP